MIRDLFPPLNNNDGKREGLQGGRGALGAGTGLCKETVLGGERQSHGCRKQGEFWGLCDCRGPLGG